MFRPIVLVTGATDGIGSETARQLVARGHDVVVHGRNARRVEATRKQLEEAAGRTQPAGVIADFASLAQVRALAEELDRRGVRPTVLVNNAGLYARRRSTSEDGFELTLAVNHLAPVALTHRLLAATGCKLERIVNVASMVHAGGQVDPDDIGNPAGPFDPYAAYAASKLANVLFTVALASRVAARGVKVNALHPGVIATKLLNEGFGMSGGGSVAGGAQTSVMLASEPMGAEVTGRYFVGRSEARMHPLASDRAFVDRYYLASARTAGVEPIA